MIRIAVIGCGIVGAAIAYELSSISQLKVTVIDAETPASGSTGAALGLCMGVISQKTKGKSWKLRQTSLERYETLISELENINSEIIPFNRQGILMLRYDDEDRHKWEKLIVKRSQQNYRLEIWDLNKLRSKCPQIDNNKVIGAIYSPDDRQVHPQILTAALVKAASKQGVEFKFNTVVEKAIIRDDRAIGLETASGRIDLDWLIVSAGLGSTPITADLARKIEIRPVLGQALRLKLERNLGNSDFQPAITFDDIHLVPLGNGEYWLGATLEFPPETGEIVARSELKTEMKRNAIANFPDLAAAETIASWSGSRPRPWGQPAPIIGKLPGYANVILATAHYRNGIFLAPGTALKIKELIEF